MVAGKKKTQVRIIGGDWRGRRLPFPDVPGLRPSPDRVRETLFNWLSPVICGADCLDLFCGSGALGFEAASRGASSVVMVETERVAARCLRENAERLQATGIQIHEGDALDYLAGAARAFDVIFLDPPYSSGLLQPGLELISSRGWAQPGTRVYIETSRERMPELPEGWSLDRSKSAGQVGYHLALVS